MSTMGDESPGLDSRHTYSFKYNSFILILYKIHIFCLSRKRLRTLLQILKKC